ncbi:MAG: Bax inhibitor-1/YccA family protein [Prevotella sp.]
MNRFEMENVMESRAYTAASAFPVLMRKVYVWMTLALVVTAATAYGVLYSPGVFNAIVSNSALFWGLLIAEFLLVIGLSAAINRMSLFTATLAFLLYSVVNGATLSVILYAYTEASVVSVFLITAGTFATMAVVGYTTKKDLSSWGKMFMFAIIGIIIASLVNVFLIKSTGLDLLISIIGVLLFVGLTAYDSQKIKNMLMMAPDAGENMQKLALLGSLSLYLDFINLFIYLLRIFGGRRD